MDINKIFGQFNSSSNSGGFDNKSFNYYNPRNLPTLDENHPKYFIRMFWKLIINYMNYNSQLLNFFSSSESFTSTHEIEYAGRVMLHARAYGYVQNIDIGDQYHQKILKEEDHSKLVEAYSISIKFHEQEEEYEKCAFLKKQLDFIKTLS